MTLGIRVGIGHRRIVASGDPMAPVAALPLTLYLDGEDYVVGTWAGRASAGTSGSHNATSDGHDPAVGATLNGIPTVSFTGASSQRLVLTSTIDNYISASAWSAWALVKMTSEPADATSYYDNACIVADSLSYFSCGVRSTGPRHGVTQFGGSGGTAQDTFTNGTWQLLQWKYAGGQVKARTNSGAWVPVSETAVAVLTGTGRIGSNYAQTLHITGLIANMGMADSARSDADFDTIKTALNARFALSL